MKTSPKIGS